MIKKHLCQIAEIFTINLLSLPIDLKHTKLWVSINFVSWRMSYFASVWVSAKFVMKSIKIQTKFAVIDCLNMMISWRKRCVVPYIASVLTKLKKIYCSYLCCKFMFFNFFLGHAMLIIFQKVFFVINSLFFFFYLSKQLLLPLNFIII